MVMPNVELHTIGPQHLPSAGVLTVACIRLPVCQGEGEGSRAVVAVVEAVGPLP